MFQNSEIWTKGESAGLCETGEVESSRHAKGQRRRESTEISGLSMTSMTWVCFKLIVYFPNGKSIMTGESIKDIYDISYIFVWSPLSRSKRNPLGHRTATKNQALFQVMSPALMKNIEKWLGL